MTERRVILRQCGCAVFRWKRGRAVCRALLACTRCLFSFLFPLSIWICECRANLRSNFLGPLFIVATCRAVARHGTMHICRPSGQCHAHQHQVSEKSRYFRTFPLIFVDKLPKILPAGEAPPPSKEILAGAVVVTTLAASFVYFSIFLEDVQLPRFLGRRIRQINR